MNRVNTTTVRAEVSIEYLAGLIDGEGCLHFGRATKAHTVDALDCWIQIGMTHKPTIEAAAGAMRLASGDPCNVRYKVPSPDPRGYKRRPQWIVSTSSKRGILRLARALLPYLVTKHLECQLIIAYLEKAVQHGKYRATALDHAMADVARRLKLGCDEAPAEALELLRAVTSSEASEGTGSEERVETRSVSPNNNPTHERPAPTLNIVKGRC